MKKLYGNPNGKIEKFIIINVNNPPIQFRDNVDYTNKTKRKHIDTLLSNVEERDKYLNNTLQDLNVQFIKLGKWTYFIINEPESDFCFAEFIFQKGYIFGTIQDNCYTVSFKETDGRSYPHIYYREKSITTHNDIDCAIKHLLNKHKNYDLEGIKFGEFINKLNIVPCGNVKEYNYIQECITTVDCNPRILAYTDKPVVKKDKKCFAILNIKKGVGYKYAFYHAGTFEYKAKEFGLAYQVIDNDNNKSFNYLLWNIAHDTTDFIRLVLALIDRANSIKNNRIFCIGKTNGNNYDLDFWELDESNKTNCKTSTYKQTHSIMDINLDTALKEYSTFYNAIYGLDNTTNNEMILEPLEYKLSLATSDSVVGEITRKKIIENL